jgi:hypothetical protein
MFCKKLGKNTDWYSAKKKYWIKQSSEACWSSARKTGLQSYETWYPVNRKRKPEFRIKIFSQK